MLWVIVGYCWVLLCTTGYWGVFGGIGCSWGTGGTDRHCGGTARQCGGTTEYWVALEVIEIIEEYCGILWGTVRYCWVLQGAGGTGRGSTNRYLGYYRVLQCTWIHCRVHGTAVPCNLWYHSVPTNTPQCNPVPPSTY